MNRIRRALVWLKRCRHCRGFGVQSPWAYRFIRYVVNEHYAYYAYGELAKSEPKLDVMEKKLHRLYFRMSNYMQADAVVSYGGDADMLERYMQRGCRKTRTIVMASEQDLETVERVRLARVLTTGSYRSFFQALLKKVDGQSAVVIQFAKRDPAAKQFWKEVEADPRCITTFDLYYCGIIFFDTKRYKENYIVNF
ncbi:MAG: hypothetical protein SPI18_10155 [Prevotella sp.]|nr:hypothetical protein [Prevotella sp.]